MQPNCHLAAFYASLAASQTNLPIAPVVDPALTTNNNGMLLPENMRVGKVFASGLGVTEGRIAVPSLRIVSQPWIQPVNKALYPVDVFPVIDYGINGPRILRSETFSLQLTSDATAGPNASYGLFWLYNSFRPAPAGDITTIKATTTVTGVAGSWVLGALTLEQDLPSGRYAIVGAQAIGATAIALRFAFAGGGYRPGILVQQAAGQFSMPIFEKGNSGWFGEFDNSLPPQVDVLATAGAVTISLYIDIVKVG